MNPRDRNFNRGRSRIRQTSGAGADPARAGGSLGGPVVRELLQPRHLLPHEAEVGLIHQCGGLQRVIGALAAQIDLRQLVQFVIDAAGGQILDRLVTLLGGGE